MAPSLPVGWKAAPLGEVATVVNGGTPKSKVTEYWDGDVQWLTPKDMGKMEGREIAATPRTISDAGLARSSARLVPPQSVILSTRAPIGHLAINSKSMAFNQGCRGLVPGRNLDHIYLYYFLAANKKKLDDLGSGTTFKELSATNLKSVPIPLPPLEEQKRIVAMLDQAFAALDRARALAEANLADAERLACGFLDAQIHMLFARFGRVRIDDLASIKGGKRLPKGVKTKIERTPYPYISVRDMTDDGTVDVDTIRFIDAEVQATIERYTISSDDVYVSIAGTIAKTGVIPPCLDGANLTENAAKLVLSDGWQRDFVYWSTRSSDFRDQAIEQTRIAAQPKLALQRLGNITIPKAEEAEQRKLAERMISFRNHVSELRSGYTAKLNDIADLRQSLLQKAFSGQLT